jgi:chorismate mutase
MEFARSMSSTKPSLDALRREIDEIDAALHDLILRRTQIVEQVAALKPRAKPAIRPGREAVIIRRLLARHTGPFPAASLTRMWREMLSAATRLQGPFSVAVCAPEDHPGFWDIARDHFGSFTPMSAVATPQAVLRALAEGTATIGVVPFPEDDDPDPWWRYLMAEDSKTPRVVARLPFCGRGNGRGEERDALAVAAVPAEPTGDDRTLLGLELAEDISRGRIKDMLEASALPMTQSRSYFERDGGVSIHLVEIDDYVEAKDPRVKDLRARMGEALLRALPIGGYATPIGAEPRKG